MYHVMTWQFPCHKFHEHGDYPALCIRKLLREQILKVLITRSFCNYVWWWILTRLIVAIISQYTPKSNHYVCHLKLICYMSIILQSKNKNNCKIKNQNESIGILKSNSSPRRLNGYCFLLRFWGFQHPPSSLFLSLLLQPSSLSSLMTSKPLSCPGIKQVCAE